MEKRVFRRKIYQQMLQWKQESDGETALLIEGARRVGKSTIVEEFARREYKSFVFIDWSKASKSLKDLFDFIDTPNDFFARLQVLTHTELYERESVIIFDEVQKYPIARQAIKHLVADGRYDYIETGSLISIRQNVQDIIIPSEEESVEMFPLDYEEFRWALGDTVTFDFLREHFAKRKGCGDSMNRQLMRDFRLYMLIGGMPQAVNKWIDTQNFSQVDKVKRAIIKLYEEDFHKLDKTDKAKSIWRNVPGQLSMNANRYQITTVSPNIKAYAAQILVNSMEESKTVNICYHANDPQVGMNLSSNQSIFKMYVGDIGLFVTLAFWDKSFTENVIYEKLLSDKLEVNLGYLYENVVAQMLRAAGSRLYYYTFPDNNKHSYEVDFLLSRGTKLCPIEVKSSGYARHASLDAFCEKFSSRIGERFLVYTKDLKKDGPVTMIPIYMVGLM